MTEQKYNKQRGNLRAILWIAVSTKIQANEDKVSLAEQEKLAREFCDSNNLIVIDVLSVPGHSRSESDVITLFEDYAQAGIPAYLDLRRHWQANDFDVLVAFHANRLGRSFSVQSYVLENTVKAGRKAYLIQGGWIDHANVDFQIAIGGVAAKSEIKQRLAMTEVGIRKRMKQGLHTRRMPFTHRGVRDTRGKIIALELRPELTRFFADLAELVLSGMGYLKIGDELGKRGHANPESGIRYATSHLYRILHNPYTWGYAATGYLGSEGKWAFDLSEPLPAGVEIERNPITPIPPVWTGEQAENIKRELKRRAELAIGDSRGAYHLTGLLRCARCGSRMVIAYGGGGHKKRYWLCPARPTRPQYNFSCDNRALVPDTLAKKQIESFLSRVKALGLVDLASAGNMSALNQNSSRLASLEVEITQALAQLDTLILQSATFPGAAADRAQKLIGDLSFRIESLQSEQRRLQAASDSDAKRADRSQATGRLIEIQNIWQLPVKEVNRLFNAALGKMRFLCDDGEITSIG